MSVTIHHAGQTVEATEQNWQAEIERLIAEHGPWINGVSRVEYNVTPAEPVERIEPVAVEAQPQAPVLSNSSFGGGLVMDSAAKARIEAQHAALGAAGIVVPTDQQFYATGTRMAAVGYDTQRARAREHDAQMPVRDAAAVLTQTIVDEKRRSFTLKGAEVAKRLHLNGKLTLDGYAMPERAIRALLARAESPATGYVIGLRDRLRKSRDEARALCIPYHRTADHSHLIATLIRETEAASDVDFTFRVRDGLGDVMAVVSPGYAPADAPSVLPDVLAALPSDAKGSWAYDPGSTSWELRASVFTPTPVDLQAVGEPFQGYLSFRSNDAGNGRLSGGGGILILRCLNASTYEAATERSSRTHRGRILVDLPAMARAAASAIQTLTQVWGVARSAVLTAPVDSEGALIPLSDAIPGLFRGLLTDRRSELMAVLPGRRETHVKALAETFDSERREPVNVVRADLANAFTRYAQDQPFTVRRDVETATAAWLVSGHSPRFEPLNA